MIGAVLEISDKVTVTIPQENRDGGYNPCPDGTTATVLGFAEVAYGRTNNFGYRPGIYVNRVWTQVQLETGREYSEHTSYLALADQTEYEQRVTEWQIRHENNQPETKEFLRDLPETPFWEGDQVRVKPRHRTNVTALHGSGVLTDKEPEVLVVIGIRYENLTRTRHDGSQYPAYHLSDQLGGSWEVAHTAEEIELVERGQVWKFCHNEPLEFGNVHEEATFYQALGHTEEVRNPGIGQYDWTIDEVLEAMRRGTVDAFSVGSGNHISAIKFRDENLGRRVAVATLEGFGVTPEPAR